MVRRVRVLVYWQMVRPLRLTEDVPFARILRALPFDRGLPGRAHHLLEYPHLNASRRPRLPAAHAFALWQMLAPLQHPSHASRLALSSRASFLVPRA